MQLPPLLDRLRSRLAQAWQDRAVSLKALSFALVGVVNTLIDLGIFLIAYSWLGLALVPANVLAWIVAVATIRAMTLDGGVDRRTLLMAIGVVAVITLAAFFFGGEATEDEEPETEGFDAFAGGYPVPPITAPSYSVTGRTVSPQTSNQES